MTAYGLLSLADHLADPVSGERITQAERYRIIVESAVLAEAVGFEHLGLGEHHFSRYILPAPLLLLSTIAARTETIRLGTSVTLLVNLDPLRVAEDLATLDVISSGRAEMTFARGVMESNLGAFGIVDPEELRPRFEESLRLVLRLLTEDEVTWQGRFRSPLARVRVEPRPVQKPHPAVFIGGGLSTISCDLAAELGLPLILPSLFRYPEDFLPIVERYRERMTANGFADRIAVSYPSYVHVARKSRRRGHAGAPTSKPTCASRAISGAASGARSTTKASSAAPPSAAAPPRSPTASPPSTRCWASGSTTSCPIWAVSPPACSTR